MKKIIIIIFLVLAVIYSCQKDNAIIEPHPSEKFTYQSYDSLGNLIVDGWLTIEYVDSVTIEGSWHLENLGKRTDIGIQEGKGELIGHIDNAIISISLNPENADHNVYLNGNMIDQLIEGDWIWTTFKGPTNWGTFRAQKQ